LGQVARIMARIPDTLETRQVLDIVQSYTMALDLLDDYDHQRLSAPKGNEATYVLEYDECRRVIDGMRFGNESDLFGVEKDDSFKGSIGNIYQSFDGQDVYPSLQEKAANLLYFVVKNHSFLDGNKRIAAALFLYFLDRNGMLFDEYGQKCLADEVLVAVTIMIAESRPQEKEVMVSLVMQFLCG
jgi:prophage maintenance system killer protein